MEVPEVLLNGNHKLINEFRDNESLKKTLKNRPDLLCKKMEEEDFSDKLNKILKK